MASCKGFGCVSGACSSRIFSVAIAVSASLTNITQPSCALGITEHTLMQNKLAGSTVCNCGNLLFRQQPLAGLYMLLMADSHVTCGDLSPAPSSRTTHQVRLHPLLPQRAAAVEVASSFWTHASYNPYFHLVLMKLLSALFL